MDVLVIFIIHLRQLFEVYDVLPDPSLGHMVEVVKGAVNLCSGIYICVGFFGYIAFYTVDFGGNILTDFPSSLGVEVTQMGFVLSVAVSFPLVIFPIRTSVNSILFARKVNIEKLLKLLLIFNQPRYWIGMIGFTN